MVLLVTSFVVDIPVETSVVVLIPLTLIQFVRSKEPECKQLAEQPFIDYDVDQIDIVISQFRV